MKYKILSILMPLVGIAVMFFTFQLYHQFDVAVSIEKNVSHLMMNSTKLLSGVGIVIPVALFNLFLSKVEIEFQRIVLVAYLIIFIIVFYLGVIGVPFRNVIFYSFIATMPLPFGMWIGSLLILLIRTFIGVSHE